MFTTFIALAFGTTFWNLGRKRHSQQDLFFFFEQQQEQDLFNAMGSMYAANIFLGVQNSSSVQPVVVVERTFFYGERAAGMHSALPCAFGQVVVEIPYIFTQAAVYSIITYAMINFEWTVAKFF